MVAQSHRAMGQIYEEIEIWTFVLFFSYASESYYVS